MFGWHLQLEKYQESRAYNNNLLKNLVIDNAIQKCYYVLTDLRELSFIFSCIFIYLTLTFFINCSNWIKEQ